MMTTTDPTTTYKTPELASDVKFLQELEETFGEADFKARIYPDADGAVAKAKVNTGDDIAGDALQKLIEQASRWKLDLTIARSGAGIRVLFEKE